jgi:hypothetical protein
MGQEVQLIITLDAQGQIQVNGPLDNMLLCFGLLELAKVSVKDYNVAKQQRVQLAPPSALVGLDGGKK